VYGYQGYARTFGGRPHEAIEPLETAMRLSPFDPLLPSWRHFLGRAYYWMGDYETAVAIARQTCQAYQYLGAAYRTLIAALGHTGQAGEAQRVHTEAIERFGDDFPSQYTGTRPAENRPEDHAHLIEGWRKAGVFD